MLSCWTVGVFRRGHGVVGRRCFVHWSVTAPWISDPSQQNWLEPWVRGSDHTFTLIAAPELGDTGWQSGRTRQLKRVIDCSRVGARAVRARRSGGVITLFPPLATTVSTIKQLTSGDFPILAWNFNLGVVPRGAKRWVLQKALERVDRFVVHSNWEREQYSRCFEISMERFEFVPVQRAMPDTPSFESKGGSPRDFVLAMGTAQRDYKTLFEALKRTGYPAVVVSGDVALAGLDVPDNVTIKQNLSYDACWQLLVEARFSVLPVKVKSGASGQTTIVDAMFRGSAIVVTRCPGLSDYLEEGETGLFYEPEDAGSLASQLERLWDDDTLRVDLAKRARGYAEEHFSDQAVAERLRLILDQLV